MYIINSFVKSNRKRRDDKQMDTIFKFSSKDLNLIILVYLNLLLHFHISQVHHTIEEILWVLNRRKKTYFGYIFCETNKKKGCK